PVPLQCRHATFDSWSSLQNLNQRPSFVISYNSHINATVFFLSKSCPCNPFSFIICSSNCFCLINNVLRFIRCTPVISFFSILCYQSHTSFSLIYQND